MRVVLGIIALIFATACGYYLSRKYTIKRQFYEEFNSFNNSLKSEISFTQSSLVQIVARYKDESSIFYKNLFNKLNSDKPLEMNKNIFGLDEVSYFQAYLDNLGTSDRKTQIDFLSKEVAFLTDKAVKAKDDEKKYKQLYIKMGFLVGLLIFIIIL